MRNKMNSIPRVLITGCSGLIGSRLVGKLESDFHVIGMDVEPIRRASANFDFIRCDLTDDRSVAAAISDIQSNGGTRIASVIHLAAYYDFSGEPSPLYRQLTVEGTRRLLRELKRVRLTVEQFVFASTLLVMKPAEDGERLTEGSPIDAEWDYPESKIETEEWIRNDKGDIPAVIFRVAGVYDENCHSIPIAQQIRRIYEKQLESYVFPGNQNHGQSFVHLDDLVDCFQRTIERRADLDDFEVFLVGEKDVLSYDDLQDRLGMLIHDTEWPTLRIPKAVAKVGAWAKDKIAGSEDDEPFIKPWMIDLADQNYPIDNSRARQRLGWTPRHTLRDTLPEMISRMKRDPQRWYERHQLPQPEDASNRSDSETVDA